MSPTSAHQRTLFARVCLLIFLAATVCGAALRAAPLPVDPFVGDWLWNQDRAVTIKADGTAHAANGTAGTWQYLGNPEVQRHYRVVWSHGKYVDEVACSEDAQRAHVRSLTGEQYNIRRAIADPPAASSPPGRIPVSPVSVRAENTTATAQPAGPADPIIGEWRWLKGRRVIFMEDGTVTASNGPRGTWKFLHNPEADRKYRLDWDQGKYIDNFSYDLAAKSAHVVNQTGEAYDVTPKTEGKKDTAPAAKSGDYFGVPGG